MYSKYLKYNCSITENIVAFSTTYALVRIQVCSSSYTAEIYRGRTNIKKQYSSRYKLSPVQIEQVLDFVR